MLTNFEIKHNCARSGKFLFVTFVVYAAILLGAGVTSILLWSQELVEAFNVSTMLAPPPPVAAPKPVVPPSKSEKSLPKPKPDTFTHPTKAPERIPDPRDVRSRPVVPVTYPGVPDGRPGQPHGVPDGVDPSKDISVPPPPPSPPPRPTPTPNATPEPPKIIKVSGGVIQGSAKNKVQPTYPPIAKAARAQGAVQVQVLISEEGRVMEASVVSGHPLLREASLQAARQWIFKPTELTGVPVKVQGVLTFNFTLQ